MKKYVVTIILLVFLMVGCEEYAATFSAGAAAGAALAENTQARFLETVNEVNKETARLNGYIESVNTIDPNGLVKPEVIEAYKSLRGREKDPVSWVALASVLANMFWGGQTYARRKTPQ